MQYRNIVKSLQVLERKLALTKNNHGKTNQIVPKANSHEYNCR